ncbi:uncharacterized protein LOC144584060 [Pogona vitticeps]
MGQAYILRSRPRGRDSHSITEASHPEGTLQGHPERVLLPILCCSKEGRGSSTHTGFERSQHLPQSSEVPDGYPGRDRPSAQERRLVCSGGSEGCLLSCNNPRGLQKVPSTDLPGHHIPICSPAIRPLHRPTDLYQVYGPSGSLSTSPGDPNLPIHRRLADSVKVRTPSLPGHSSSSADPTGLRPIHQLREVSFTTLSSDGLHRGQAGCRASPSVHTSRTCLQNKKSSSEVQAKGDSIGKASTTPARPHGLNNGHLAPCETQNALPTILADGPVQPCDRQSSQAPQGHSRTCKAITVVALSSTSANRKALSSSTTHHTGDNGRQPDGMGSPLSTSPDTCSVVPAGSIPAYQPSRDAGGDKGLQGVSSSSQGHSCTGSNRQYHHDVLPEQARGHEVQVSAVSHSTFLGMVLPEAHFSSDYPCGHIRQPVGGRTQSSPVPIPRVATGPEGIHHPLPSMGTSTGGHVCHAIQHEVSTLCVPRGQGTRLHRGRVHGTMEGRPHLPVSSSATPSEGHSQTTTDEGRSHTNCPLVATSTVVLHSVSSVSGQGDSSIAAQLTHSERRECSPSRPRCTPLDCVEDFPSLTEVIIKARKPATKLLYSYKWRNFLRFAEERQLHSSPVALSTLLLYLRHLFDLGLSKSTLKVYTAAIVAFQPPGSESSRWFSHPTLKAFFKGLDNMRPPAKRPIPQWSLQTVLHCLTRHPFEPMASCDLKFLSFKTLFLVAITSARRASELAALRADPPYLQFFKDKVVLHPDVTFLPKVVSTFHVNQPLILPTPFPDAVTEVERMLHALDVRRALAYYVTRTKDFRKAHRLFLCFYGPRKGSPASSSSLSRWLVSTISLAYELLQKPVPEGLKAHSTRAMATSTALLRGVDIQEICRSATWSNASTFVTHYKLDLRAKAETKFGRAVLTSLLQ